MWEWTDRPSPSPDRRDHDEARSSGVDRPLDRTEALFSAFNAAGAYLVGAVAAVDGPLDEELLARALARVQQRHPKLRARIVDAVPGPRFVDGGAAPPALRVAAAGARDPASLLVEQFHEPFAPSDALWRCTFARALRPGAPHHLAFGVHHAIADGRSVFQIAADVVEACGALRDGRAAPPALAPGPPLDDVLPAVSMRAALLQRLHALRARGAPHALEVFPVRERAPAERRRSRVVVRSTRPELLARVVERCRSERAPVGGALTAALVSALRDLSGSRRRIAVSHQVSLRQRCRPAITGEQIGCYVGSTYTRHALGDRAGFWETARGATRELRGAIQGDICAAGVHATRPIPAAFVAGYADDAATLGRVGIAGISNRGRMPRTARGPFVLREYYSGAGAHIVGNLFQLSCGSLDGRLSLTLVTPDPLVPAETAERFLDTILERLDAAVLDRRVPAAHARLLAT